MEPAMTTSAISVVIATRERPTVLQSVQAQDLAL